MTRAVDPRVTGAPPCHHVSLSPPPTVARPSSALAYRPQVHVVFLHALPFDGRMWDNQVRRLGRPASAPTVYGSGASLEAWARKVLAEARHEPLLLVGNSVGGSCALEIARVAPARVAGLVLVGTKAAVRPDPEARDGALRLLAERGIRRAWTTYWEPLFGPKTPSKVVAHARRLACEQRSDDIARGVRAFHDRRDLTDVAVAWRNRTFVIVGEHDRTPAPLVAAKPGARCEVVPDAGHYVSLEQPEVFGRLLDAAIDDLVAFA